METLYVGEGENHRLNPVEYSTMLENNYKRDVFTREKIIEEEQSLKLLEVWNSHVWRESLIRKLARIALSPLVFILHLL